MPQLQTLASITDGINSCTNSTESKSAQTRAFGPCPAIRRSGPHPPTSGDARRGGSRSQQPLAAGVQYPFIRPSKIRDLGRSCVITPEAAIPPPEKGRQNLPGTDLPDHRRITGTKGYPCQVANQLKSAIHVPARLTRRDGSKCRRAGAAQSPQFG